jgi:hypothetical protein
LNVSEQIFTIMTGAANPVPGADGQLNGTLTPRNVGRDYFARAVSRSW